MSADTRDAIVDFILEHVEEHGFPPSIREIGAAVGLASPSTTHSHLQRLIKDGRLSMVAKSPRTLRVLA